MTAEERAQKAAELKATGKCNCTQAVLAVYKDELPLEEEEYLKLASGFAAGMGCMESTCGALIGAVMVLGIKSDGKAVPPKSRKLVESFREKCGATICKDLKGIETGKMLCACPDCVKNAVLSLEELTN